MVSTRGHKDMIFVIEWNPFDPNYLVSVGEKHIKFWTQKGIVNFNQSVTIFLEIVLDPFNALHSAHKYTD